MIPQPSKPRITLIKEIQLRDKELVALKTENEKYKRALEQVLKNIHREFCGLGMCHSVHIKVENILKQETE